MNSSHAEPIPTRESITWHTRATGTYRLFSCCLKKRDVTLAKSREVITA